MRCVGVGDSSNNWLGSSVAERPARNGVVPGSIPGLAFSFSSYTVSLWTEGLTIPDLTWCQSNDPESRASSITMVKSLR